MRIAVCVEGYVTERNMSDSMENGSSGFVSPFPSPFVCECMRTCINYICVYAVWHWYVPSGNSDVEILCGELSYNCHCVLLHVHVCVCSYHCVMWMCDHTHTFKERCFLHEWQVIKRRFETALGWGCSQARNMWLWYRMVLWGSCDQCLWSWRVWVDLCFSLCVVTCFFSVICCKLMTDSLTFA